MNTGFITPIQMPKSLSEIGTLQESEKVNSGNKSVFKDILGNMVNNVNETEANLEQQQYLLATGQIDDVHTVPIAESEAQLAVDLLVQLRNKALDSYNELMRIGL